MILILKKDNNGGGRGKSKGRGKGKGKEEIGDISLVLPLYLSFTNYNSK